MLPRSHVTAASIESGSGLDICVGCFLSLLPLSTDVMGAQSTKTNHDHEIIKSEYDIFARLLITF